MIDQKKRSTKLLGSSGRRRIWLMRHGHVAYAAEGAVVANPDLVPLSERGRRQAAAAGAYLKALGISSFDRVVSSNLPRTAETAKLVMAGIGQKGGPEQWPELREIKGGGSSWGPVAEIPRALAAFAQHAVTPQTRWMGGESVAEAAARILPALERLRGERDWDCALLVLHNLVNVVILSHVLTGGSTYLGRLEQNFGCINALDVGHEGHDWIVRAVNICPEPAHYERTRDHSLEIMAEQARERGKHG
jgi:probable phosphoglycerate mutase